jgi:hypothetical protein
MVRLLVRIVVAALAVLLAGWGVVALAYGGDANGGSTYVTLAGVRLDAQLAGVVSLLVAALLVVCALRLRRPAS